MDKYLSTSGSISKKDALSTTILKSARVVSQDSGVDGSRNDGNHVKITNSSSNSSKVSSSQTSLFNPGILGSKRNNHSIQVHSGESVASSWDDVSVVSETALSISDKKRKLSLDKGLTGWKMKDGARVYQTFRGGKLVSASGGEAFKLSMTDSKGKNNGKNKGVTTTGAVEKE